MPTLQVSTAAFLRDLIVSMVGLALGRIYPTLHPAQKDLTGKVAIVTGSNSGIGLQIALDLIKQNATVYLACRNKSKADDAVSEINSKVPGSLDRVKTLSLDTSSPSSVKDFVKKWEQTGSKIDILFHNAGLSNAPQAQPFTPEGFPTVYATNLLGSFLLTQLLEDHLAIDARVIFTSSTGQYAGNFSSSFSLTSVKNRLEPGFHAPKLPCKDSVIYSHSKAMQVCFARLLQERWDRLNTTNGKVTKRTAHSFTPSFTSTPIFGKVPDEKFWQDPSFWILRKSEDWLATDVSQGSATGVWLATTDDEEVVGEGKGGKYWDRMTRRLSRADMASRELLDRLWVRWEADAGVEWR